jgi:hypothetical protein
LVPEVERVEAEAGLEFEAGKLEAEDSPQRGQR